MALTPLPPDEVQRRLAAIRSFRLIAYLCVLTPVAFIIAVVALNRLTNGGLHVLVAGAPWTRMLWYTVLGVFFTGCLLLVACLGRRCPRCGGTFFASKHYKHGTRHLTRKGGANVFGGRCMNCKLPLR
jgi:hypothetical protein